MGTTTSSVLAVETLSWINEHLLLELDRRMAAEIRSPAAFWRRQGQAILSLLICGINLLTFRGLW